jgi:HSF-type DNA-binding
MNRPDAGKEAEKKKFDPRLVPTFLQKTYALVDSKDSKEIVGWGAEPNTFVIYDPNRFAREVLPQYFKQNKMSSFVRQVLSTHTAQHV